MEDLGWKAEAGVKLRSPKGRAAARGLDARIPLPTHFHASGRHFIQIISTQSKIPLDSDHGIYRAPKGALSACDSFSRDGIPLSGKPFTPQPARPILGLS
jgi:hypothetical protein